MTSPTTATRPFGVAGGRTFGLIDDDTHCGGGSDEPRGRVRIVLVEDDCWIRSVIHDVLAEEGFVVLDASDGHMALRVIAEHEPDLVLLDLAMPGLNGVGVLHSLRRDVRTRDLPVVVLSAYPAVLSAQAASCARGVLSKPVDISVLLDAVRQALESTSESLYAIA